MNRYFFIRRLTGPAILLLLGILALLNQAGVASWNLFVPLLLILLGVLKLAERAALASDPSANAYFCPGAYPGAPYGLGGVVNATAEPGAQAANTVGPENGPGSEGGAR
jgi:hypothetical protein